MKSFLIFVIKLYQKTLSPDHGWLSHWHSGGYCRFQPTCSDYAIASFADHGVLRGSFLTIARVSRCHPWGPLGADPVLDKQIN